MIHCTKPNCYAWFMANTKLQGFLHDYYPILQVEQSPNAVTYPGRVTLVAEQIFEAALLCLSFVDTIPLPTKLAGKSINEEV